MVKLSIKLNSRLPLIVAVVLLILQIFSPAPPVMFTLIALSGVLGVSYLWTRQLASGVSLQRQRRYGWAQVGDIFEERFIMDNDSWVPVLWAELLDFSDPPGYSASRGIGLAARSSTRWTTTGTCERRGVYTLGPTQVIMGDPFGIFEVTLAHNFTETFVVYPPIAALPPLVEPRGITRGSVRANIRSLTFTTNASSVRPYVPGDTLKRIHWRSTARHSLPGQEEILVKEFDLEPSGDLWIILDMDPLVQAGEDLESTEEYAILLAASLTNQMVRANHAVGLIAYGQEPIVIPPQKGHQQLWEILRVLAGLHAESTVPLNELLSLLEPVIGRGRSAAIITPSANPDWIKGLSILLRHAIYPTALLLDGQSFGGDGDMRGIMGLLADLGIIRYLIDKSFEFKHLTQKRQQRPVYRTLGTGRVIVVSPGEKTDWVSLGQRTEDLT
jgi:uncharacterized protein (DUF58 family)